MKTPKIGYQLGFYIEEPNKNRDYELTKNIKTWLSCPEEDMNLWGERVKGLVNELTNHLLNIQNDYDKLKGVELSTLNLSILFTNMYCKVHKGVKIIIPHLVMYYLQYDKKATLDLLNNLKVTYELVSDGKEGLIYSPDGRNTDFITKDVLEISMDVNNFDKTLKLIEENIKLESYDVSEIIKIYRS